MGLEKWFLNQEDTDVYVVALYITAGPGCSKQLMEVVSQAFARSSSTH